MSLRKKSQSLLLKASPVYRRLTHLLGIVENVLNRQKHAADETRKLIEKVDRLQATVDQLGGSLHETICEVGQRIDANVYDTRSLLAATINVTEMPKSQGVLRDIQDISLKMLQEVDRICKMHNLSYWLDFGTLLGAVRHRGFIPWDDDMDIAMVDSDYQKFLSIVDEELKDTDFRFIHVPSQIGKIVHKDFMPHGEEEITKFIHWELQGKLSFALDVFPYYYAKESLTDGNLKKYLKAATAEGADIFNGEHKYSNFSKADRKIKEHTKKYKSAKKTNRLFLGLETRVYQPRIVSTDDVFPLIRVEFEGGSFNAPRNSRPYLIDIYGDYMTLPRQAHTHLFLDTIPKDELRLLDKAK